MALASARHLLDIAVRNGLPKLVKAVSSADQNVSNAMSSSLLASGAKDEEFVASMTDLSGDVILLRLW